MKTTTLLGMLTFSSATLLTTDATASIAPATTDIYEFQTTLRPVLIAESDLPAVFNQGTAASPNDRTEAAVANSAANSPAALGILADQASGPFQTNLLIVTRDAKTAPLEATDIYFVPRRVTASLPRFGANPRLALSRPMTPHSCLSPRGCRPVFSNSTPQKWGGANDERSLSAETVLNAEIPEQPANGSGRRPELWLLSQPNPDTANRFVCSGEVAVANCRNPVTDVERWAPSSSPRVALGEGIAVIAESDYLALRDGLNPGAEQAQQQAIRLSTLGNTVDFVGVEATIGTPAVSPSVLIVARDLQRIPGQLFTTEFYVVPGRPSRLPEIVGTLPSAVFSKPIPNLTTLSGPCGAIITPGSGPAGCPVCLAESAPNGPRYGEERWPSANRVTVRILSGKTRDISVYACTQRLPVDRTDGLCSPGPETCNGESETCAVVDGQIKILPPDSGKVCEICVTP